MKKYDGFFNLRRLSGVLSVVALMLVLVSCSIDSGVKLPVITDYIPAAPAPDKKNLKMGVVTGPYGEMFTDAILPSLQQKGYNVQLVYYTDFINPNFALANGYIDLNMFQHHKYLNDFKFKHNLALSAITEIPTATMVVHSKKYKSIAEVQKGDVVAIPDDNTNLSRALRVLESTGLIAIDPTIDKSKATEVNVIRNTKQIEFALVPAQNLVNSLDVYDVVVINGNFAMASGLDRADALYCEVLAENYINVIAVRTEDLGKQFVRDLIDVTYTNVYREAIIEKYGGFQRPRNFYENRNWGMFD